ncbi:HupE/UreJ family protein [Chitinophaga deserti]|uniref:HupE/UreJ family protein n=1 Tax=Chitinophaga deserti TaxID=2164099 RepID=UPI000D6D9EB7|nr:HupE/UreJ family protein [Chitinophaga deserti]
MQEFSMYFEEGWQHIADLGGYDHILFIMALCAVYLMNDWKKVLILVTAFTVGHSITLALSVLNIVRVSTDLIEFLIPVTIVITALGNALRGGKEPGRVQWNYFLALFFGLIHGLGFSNYLRSMLGTQSDIVQPLLAFNLGLEFGQLIIVTIILILSQLIIQIGKVSRRDWTIFLSAAIFGVAFVMSIERIGILLEK